MNMYKIYINFGLITFGTDVLVNSKKFIRAKNGEDGINIICQESNEDIKRNFENGYRLLSEFIDRVNQGQSNQYKINVLQKLITLREFKETIPSEYTEFNGPKYKFIHIILNSSLIKDELFDFTLLESISSYY